MTTTVRHIDPRKQLLRFLLMISLCLLIPVQVDAQKSYKTYQPKNQSRKFFSISRNDKGYTVTVYDDAGNQTSFTGKSASQNGSLVTIGSDVMFEPDALVAGGERYAYGDILESKITGDDDLPTTITFLKSVKDTKRSQRQRMGNIVSFDETIEIEPNEFIRGMVFSVIGDVIIAGEVNKDVISLFGHIYVEPDAVLRGDVATLIGNGVEIPRQANIYGEVFSQNGHKRRYAHRFARLNNLLDYTPYLGYNRVDGLALYSSLRYDDRDSLLPSVWLSGGYAIESERMRFEFGAEQTVLRKHKLVVGASIFRELATEDNWVARRNLLFALTATEDYRDYYEATGGRVYLKLTPYTNLDINLGYRSEDNRWLKANRHLWSLAGGDKLFDPNFPSVEGPLRQQGIDAIENNDNRMILGSIDYDQHDPTKPFEESAWHVSADFEWSHPDMNSDYDYSRGRLFIRRYQKISRRSMLLSRFVLGGSNNSVPMHKLFYLGGLATLEGYQHKELIGTDFRMLNTEYRTGFSKTDFAISLNYDLAQIANQTKLDSDVEIKQSIGAALYLGNDFRASISRRLDISSPDLRFHLRLAHTF